MAGATTLLTVVCLGTPKSKSGKLSKRDDKMPSFSTEPVGKKLPCAYINVYDDTVVFEPDSDPITKKGYYLVRLKGSGIREQYLVKLF